jgi:hypothetical protein
MENCHEHIARIEQLVNERDRTYMQAFAGIKEKMDIIATRDALALAAAREAVNVAMTAAEKAVTKAEYASEKRFESVNEFRAQMSDMQATFARSDLVSSRFESLEKKIDELAGYRSSSMGRSTAFNQGFGWIAIGIGALSSLMGAGAALFFK